MKGQLSEQVVVSSRTAGGVTNTDDITPHVRSWRVDIDVFETGDRTAAHATLVADAPGRLDGRGEALRNPVDVAVPEIGDEIAVARALRRLSDRLFEAASLDITGSQGHPAAVSR